MSINLPAFEAWLCAGNANPQVSMWRVQGLDLWPLINTSLSSLAIQFAIRLANGQMTVGSLPWRLGVLADYFGASPIRCLTSRAPSRGREVSSLGGRILYYCSQVQARTLGNVLVTAPLDVPATLMRRAGHEGVIWFEDMASNDPRLRKSLTSPAEGVADLLATARNRAWSRDMARRLRNIPGLTAWLGTAASYLRLSTSFVEIWIARQVGLALASARTFDEVFAARGHPKLLLLLNGGFASTSGLTAAARSRRIPVVEVQHGAISAGLFLAAPNAFAFKAFNTAPDSMITWDLLAGSSSATLAVGPIGLHLPAIIGQTHRTDSQAHRALRENFAEQAYALRAYAEKAQAQREVLVSLQPGDAGHWLAALSKELPGVLFWIRRHGAGLDAMPTPGRDGMLETDFASTCPLSLLLNRVHAHITRFSAVVLEAAACGIPSIALEPYASTLYGHLVPAPLLQMESDLTHVASLLQKIFVDGERRERKALLDPERIVPFLEHLMARSSRPGGV
jgi:hypothetical protein